MIESADAVADDVVVMSANGSLTVVHGDTAHQSAGAVSEADLRSAFEHAPVGVAVLTLQGVITACNAQLGVLLGRPPSELVGRTLFSVTHPDHLDAAHAACEEMQSGRPRLRHDVRLLRADGNPVWVSVSSARVPAVHGRPTHLVLHLEDVDHRKELEDALLHRALHDPLTGLANRALLVERVEQALAQALRREGSACVFMLDLNGFKGVNDTYGHAAGDLVLQQLADRITSVLRPGDTAARLGGDEFVALCVDVLPEQVQDLGSRLRAAAGEAYQLETGPVRLSAAVGIAVSLPEERDAADLLRRADLAMYADKPDRRAAAT